MNKEIRENIYRYYLPATTIDSYIVTERGAWIQDLEYALLCVTNERLATVETVRFSERLG